MQKVVIAREMEKEPLALIVAQPTRGLDVGATEFVHAQILAAADRGCAILLISSELSEIFALSDRIARHVPRANAADPRSLRGD